MNADEGYYVYIYYRLDTNEPFYVGKGTDKRWMRIYEYERNNHFINIINKYPIAVDLICENLTNEQACDIECWLINELVFEYGFSIDIPNNRSNEKGMHLVNATWGGDGASGCNPYEGKTKKELKEWNNKRRKSRKETWDGKSEEEKDAWRNKLSENHADVSKENHPMWGRKQSQEARDRMSKNKKGKYIGEKSPNSKKVICLNTLKIFNCIRDVIRDEEYCKYNCQAPAISRICKNNKRILSTGVLPDGTHLTWMYLEDYENTTKEEIEIKIKKANKQRSNPVICLNTSIIYKNINQASVLTGVDSASIYKCCNHTRQSAGKTLNGEKLVWLHLDEFLKKCILIQL